MINVATLFVSRSSRDQFSARRMNKREKFIAIFNRCRERHVIDPRLAAQSQLLPQGDDDEMTVSATRSQSASTSRERLYDPRRSPGGIFPRK